MYICYNKNNNPFYLGGESMNIISNQDNLWASKFDLYLFKLLYLLSFKKSKWIKKQITKITEDLETVKNRKIF